MDKINNDYKLGLYEKSMPSYLSWKEKLVICKNCGFDYLEMSIDESDEKLSRLNYTTQERKELIETMYETGVRIHSICLSAHRKYPFGSQMVGVQKESLEIMQKAIFLARDLGVHLIQLAGYDVYYEDSNAETKKDFEKNLKAAVLMASKEGVVLGFETMETEFMDTVAKTMKYVNKINSPYLGIYPDIGNLKNASLCYHNSVNDDLNIGRGHIFAAHLKETIPSYYREIPYGTGHTEFVENISVLKDQGVRMFVGEFWFTGSNAWENDIENASIFLRKKIDKVFNK